MGLFLDTVEGHSHAAQGAAATSDAEDLVRKIGEQDAVVRAMVHRAETPVFDPQAQSRPGALLAGIPLVIKDLIDVAGMPTRLGSEAVMREPQEHAEVVGRLIGEGAVIAGKSHTTEFAMSGWGVSPLGRPLNPIDTQDLYYTGGSSNGSGAAVAAGLVPAALGTDTGGSVRIPASWCGITGFKGSPGWVSTIGVAPLSQRFDAVGPMARTAADVTILYRAMLPEYRRAALELQLTEAAQRPLPTLVFLDDESVAEADSDMLAAYRTAQAVADGLGFPTQVRRTPWDFADMARIWGRISAIEGYLNNHALADDATAPLEAGARTNLLLGKNIDVLAYFELLNQANQCRVQMEELLAPGSLLVLPTTATAATRLGDFDPQRILGVFTRFVNLIQGCAIALPNGFAEHRRPTSMQFVGGYGQDAEVLHAARRWQAGTDWHEQIRQQHQEQIEALQAVGESVSD